MAQAAIVGSRPPCKPATCLRVADWLRTWSRDEEARRRQEVSAARAGFAVAAMVFLPGPFIPVLNGPPSAYALSMRPWLLGVLAALLPVATARFMVNDVIGGLFLFLTAGVGLYAVVSGMDMMWLVCLALVLFLNAVFDAAILCARISRSELPVFGESQSHRAIAVHSLLCLGPLVELVGAALCWRVYREHMSNMFAEMDERVAVVDLVRQDVSTGFHEEHHITRRQGWSLTYAASLSVT
uniref:Uncharacterized protein n=1 Tax=Alexandrium andersonii TaxID=327968 RepID=A0A7S2G078_9DINO